VRPHDVVAGARRSVGTQTQSARQRPPPACVRAALAAPRTCERARAQVLVVHGTADALVPAWNSRRLAARLPGARLVELGVCGHMPMEEAPDRFLDALADFIADLD